MSNRISTLLRIQWDAVEGELVKLKLEEKLLSMGGNKPVRIMESANIV